MGLFARYALVVGVMLVLLTFLLTGGRGLSSQPAEPSAEGKVYSIYPIGFVHKKDGQTFLVIEKRYQPGLLGLEEWSHIHVLWWFDRNDRPERRAILQVHPRGDKNNPLTGVFACRAPVRPNLIGLTVCRILAVRDNVIEIEEIDAFDGTPIIDIKPFTPGPDCPKDVRVPSWAKPK